MRSTTRLFMYGVLSEPHIGFTIYKYKSIKTLMNLDKKPQVGTSENIKKHLPYTLGRNFNIHQMHGIVRSSTILLE